jgi:hypothetical protein
MESITSSLEDLEVDLDVQLDGNGFAVFRGGIKFVLLDRFERFFVEAGACGTLDDEV